MGAGYVFGACLVGFDGIQTMCLPFWLSTCCLLIHNHSPELPVWDPSHTKSYQITHRGTDNHQIRSIHTNIPLACKWQREWIRVYVSTQAQQVREDAAQVTREEREHVAHSNPSHNHSQIHHFPCRIMGTKHTNTHICPRIHDTTSGGHIV